MSDIKVSIVIRIVLNGFQAEIVWDSWQSPVTMVPDVQLHTM